MRQLSTLADLWMSKTNSGFLMMLTQNLRGRLDRERREERRELAGARGGGGRRKGRKRRETAALTF